MTRDLDPLAVAREYWRRLEERADGLAALFLRDPLDDFVPGISDLDLRLVMDGVPSGGWPALGAAVTEVHRSMIGSGRGMWRLLEHPPGACVTLAETSDPRMFHPEMRQWQPVAGRGAAIQAVMARGAGPPWSARDDHYWRDRLTSLLAPWGPPEERINLPAGHHQRYRLHVLVMLRTLPALQAAFCLLYRRPVPGKVAALHAWTAERPENEVLGELSRILEADFDPREVARTGDEWRLEERCRALVDTVAGAALATQPPSSEEAGVSALLDLHGAVRFSAIARPTTASS